MINFVDKNTKECLPDPNLKKLETQTFSKHRSEPKFTTLQQEILKIPKVKQILQKDRFLYSQDIEKRMELLGSLKN